MRGEWRDGELSERRGVTFGAIRQLGEGSMVGAGVVWTHAEDVGGATSQVFNGTLAFAHRPAGSSIAMLGKVEFRSDSVSGVIAGSSASASSNALTVSGDARSDRLIGSVSLDWSPQVRTDEGYVQRSEVSLFGAVRYNFDTVDGVDVSGTTLFGGADVRWGLGEHFDLGATMTVRTNLSDHTANFSYGPQIGVSPGKDVLLTIGYNFSGYHDRDFSAARSTRKGVFVSVQMKFDAGTFGLDSLLR